MEMGLARTDKAASTTWPATARLTIRQMKSPKRLNKPRCCPAVWLSKPACSRPMRGQTHQPGGKVTFCAYPAVSEHRTLKNEFGLPLAKPSGGQPCGVFVECNRSPQLNKLRSVRKGMLIQGSPTGYA